MTPQGQSLTANETHAALLLKASGQSGKLSYTLTRLQQGLGAGLTFGPGGILESVPPGVQLEGDNVVVNVLAAGETEQLVGDLEALGMVGPSAAGRVVSGAVPIQSLAPLSRLASVNAVRPSLWVQNSAVVMSQGDAAFWADVARNSYGLTGLGIRVGIISDSFDALKGMTASYGTELPVQADVYVAADRSTGTDEGRAMAEIVHDVAPRAKIAFYTGAGGSSGMASAVRNLSNPARSYACQVVVDDLLYLEEPMFADGVIAQEVNAAVSRGVVYLSSAGNFARQAYESEWRQSSQLGQWNKPMFDFDPGAGDDPFLRFSVSPGTSYFVLQWQESYGWLNNLEKGAKTDLDLLVYDANDQYLGLGAFYGNIGQDPTEILVLNYTGTSPTQISIAINWYTGDTPPPFRLVWIRPTLLEHATHSPTLYGHANAAGAIAVGAAHFYDTPIFGRTPPMLASFSAAGGTPIVATAAGDPMYELRLRPDIVAPDGGNTSFFGNDSPRDPDSYPNFFGTSASAPHAAGAVALALEKASTHTPALIRAALLKSTVEMGENGFDWDTGYGLLDTDKALGKILCDVNANGCVDIQDLWQLYTQTLYSAPNSRFDLNGDFGVDSADMDMIVSFFDNYGSRCRN